MEEAYRTIELPLMKLSPPPIQPMQMSARWSLQQLLGYLNTWSAVKRYERELGCNPLAGEIERLARLWGEPDRMLSVDWPMVIKVWQKPTDSVNSAGSLSGSLSACLPSG